MNKHAYMIKAHDQPKLLTILIKSIDSEENDIVLHIDKKSPFDYSNFINIPKKSKIYFIERQNETWGGYSQIEVELRLLEKAVSLGTHSYYHLLSGADLPLRNISEINCFYNNNRGREFINFADPISYHVQYKLRLKYKHFFREKCGRDKNLFTVFNKSLWLLQEMLHLSNKQTIPESKFAFGSNWFDITQDFAEYILQNRSDIHKWFLNTSCADEVFIQYLVCNSKFKNRLYKSYFNNGIEGNMRYVDFSGSKNAGANIISDNIVNTVLNSNMMFARKFDLDTYPKAVEKVISACSSTSKLSE